MSNTEANQEIAAVKAGMDPKTARKLRIPTMWMEDSDAMWMTSERSDAGVFYLARLHPLPSIDFSGDGGVGQGDGV